tara:strand:+ start:98 stop:346 length:249 start_codon:yes stop_codon:yes gene_type:complete
MPVVFSYPPMGCILLRKSAHTPPFQTYQYHKRYTRQFHRGFFVPGFFLATTHPALFWGFLFWIIFYEILTDSFEKWFNNSDV